jgi:LCP family protein required for cell wall assembly
VEKVMKDGARKKWLTAGRFQRILYLLLAVGFVVASLALALVVHLVVRDMTASYTGIGLNPFNPIARKTTEPAPTVLGETPSPIPIDVTPVPWNGNQRITILLMGLDFRDWEENSGSPRSDTMLLITIDPLTRQGGMLSIPRDLWVEIPGFGHNRINTAYMFGEAYRLPGGGPGLAMRVVENLLGVPIQYYAVVEFSTFERLIDEIGGIDVEVKERIKISPIGRQSRWLDPKPYHLDGPDALAYARVRKYGGGDFGRAERQQQVALAVIDRIVGFDMIPTLVRKAPGLYQELSEGIRTNMSLQEMIALGWLAVRLPKENIRQGVISPPNMIAFHIRPDGANVLRYVPDQIRILRDYIFVETSSIGPSPPEAMQGVE